MVERPRRSQAPAAFRHPVEASYVVSIAQQYGRGTGRVFVEHARRKARAHVKGWSYRQREIAQRDNHRTGCTAGECPASRGAGYAGQQDLGGEAAEVSAHGSGSGNQKRPVEVYERGPKVGLSQRVPHPENRVLMPGKASIIRDDGNRQRRQPEMRCEQGQHGRRCRRGAKYHPVAEVRGERPCRDYRHLGGESIASDYQ